MLIEDKSWQFSFIHSTVTVMTVSESRIKALSHDAIFLATCIAILLLVTNVLCVKNILATCDVDTPRYKKENNNVCFEL